MAQDTHDMPRVIRFDTYPLDLEDPLKRFKTSKYNFFIQDESAKVTVGFWEAEDGKEVPGEMIGAGVAHEVMLVLEGEAHISCEGFPDEIAGPGDAILCSPHRKTQIEVKKKIRAFYFVWGLAPGEINEKH